jgi:hypothetical protein
MKLYPDFAHHRKFTRERDSGEHVAGRARSSRGLDVIVAATLLALFIVAIATRTPISGEIADSSMDRQGYVAHVIDVVATWGLSIGLALLLFFSRPRADREGTRS